MSTLIAVRTGVPEPVTVTLAEPYLVVSATDVARTVRVVRVSLAATVRRPVPLTVVPSAAPPSTTLQVTVRSGSFFPETAAVNCRVPPFSTDAAAGLTVTAVTAGGAVTGVSQDIRTKASVKTSAEASAKAPVCSLARNPVGG